MELCVGDLDVNPTRHEFLMKFGDVWIALILRYNE
jgi:hypothetical protein